jgi:hypothetical protein
MDPQDPSSKSQFDSSKPGSPKPDSSLPDSPLDDPVTAAFAWRRFKRLMVFMTLVTLAVVAVMIVLLYDSTGTISIHFYIATGLGIGFMMLLTSALMGLVFMSSGTGHDEAVDNNLPSFEELRDYKAKPRKPLRWKE